ncbi:E3 ubiquitin-protein ligase RAD18 isoform X2 [Sphaerodactylus townsendi]|uniref:E3 ubiquitin-protein ligase RAD18 isoform X2 n=1 Tax=Sphaerodactylus townsendi TaxID=933632 RepID=UPI00202701CD|nr:E3 ubiquitin-protein ligase RAD18 isoform X2 [Sphaerodactylus townsendi]
MSLVLDDSQWPEHLAPLKEVDNLLRCGICFDYFNIAMIIPQCSHNYCSLCIRKTLSNKAQCPTCCVPAVEPDLKNNRLLDDLVKTFSSASSGHKRKPLPKVVYNLLSDRDLRKRLKEYGLSTQGSKQVLIKRHQEFVHMYNSQCDSLNPKSVEEIVKELENNEKTRAQLESKMAGNYGMTFTKHQAENEIDEIHRDYRKKHKAEFQLLIDQMNKRKKKPNKTRTEKEEPEKKEPTAGKQLLEIEESQSAAEHPDLAFCKDEAVKKEALGCARRASLHLSEVKGLIVASSSGSSTSSSSDIIRDLEIAGMCSDSTENNRLPDVKMAKKKSRDCRSSSTQPRSKRRKE